MAAIAMGSVSLIPAFAQPALSATVQSAPGIEDYTLGAGDRIKLTVFNEPSFSGEYGVSDNGAIALPLVGLIDLKGKTIKAAQDLIQAQLADGYINAPQVSIEVIKYRPYYIYGEVVHAGEFPFVSGMSVQQAIAAAGGYSYRAAKRYVLIRRSGNAVENKLKFKENPVISILPGDTIRVDERHF